MNDNLAYMDDPVLTLSSSRYDLNLTIDIDILDDINCGSRDPEYERKTKEVFVKYFKSAVPNLFRSDSRFYVDYEHESDKSDSTRITKSGHTKSESNYIVLYAKNKYGFIFNSWIVNLRIGEHKLPKDTKEVDVDGVKRTVDVRKVGQITYLDSYGNFGKYLKLDKETFDQMKKLPINIVVKCGVTFKSNVTVHITDMESRKFTNCEKALNYISNYRDTLYNKLYSEIDEFFYKGYKIIGSEKSCSIYDYLSKPVESNISMSDAKSVINELTKDVHTSEVYSATIDNHIFTKRDLVDFADTTIKELSQYIQDDNYYIQWEDVHFEFNYTLLKLTVIDSDGYELEADIDIDFEDFSTDESYRNQCMMELVNQITEAYSEI